MSSRIQLEARAQEWPERAGSQVEIILRSAFPYLHEETDVWENMNTGRMARVEVNGHRKPGEDRHTFDFALEGPVDAMERLARALIGCIEAFRKEHP